jgi:FkbM family methyltransferase
LSFNIDHEEFEKFAFLYALAPNMALGLARLKERGYSPESIVDVGAFQGDWSRMVRSLWPTARLAIVEPNLDLAEMHRSTAAELNAEFHRELLGATDGAEVTFYVMEAGSSIYEERSGVDRMAQTRRIRTLDSVLSGWDGIGLLKIDAQGYELEILKGSSRLLQKTSSVLLEISLIEINQGAPLLDEVVAFMKSLGFLACEILEIHRRPLDQALNQLDFLFVREGSPLLADKRHW